MKLVKGTLVMGLILFGCFETLQFLNKLDALSRGKNFLKSHNVIAKSIECEVPARAVFDGSVRFCTFNSTPEQIKILVKNLDFRSIDLSVPSDEDVDKIYAELDTQQKKGATNLETHWKIDDLRRSYRIEEHSCWERLELKNRSELELYGVYENKTSKFRNNFFVFYKKLTEKGCIRFESIGG